MCPPTPRLHGRICASSAHANASASLRTRGASVHVAIFFLIYRKSGRLRGIRPVGRPNLTPILR
jgi:hypothetical protein